MKSLRSLLALALFAGVLVACGEEEDPNPFAPRGPDFEGTWTVTTSLTSDNGACGSLAAVVPIQFEIDQTDTNIRVQWLEDDLSTPIGTPFPGGVNDDVATYTVVDGSIVTVYDFELDESGDTLNGTVSYTDGACAATYTLSGTRVP